MPRCCGGASCSCVIQEGPHIQIAGTGSSADPFVVAGDVDLEVTDNTVFNLTLNGAGTVASPWNLSAAFATTATLNDLPDVTAVGMTNGQVLGWDSATSQWTPRAPTTAASGSVTHDLSLLGDGSAGNPLAVNMSEDRYIFGDDSGGSVGMTDVGINQMVRKFPDAAARTAASPAPTTNTISILGDAPGGLDYWDGSAWKSAGGAFLLGAVSGEEMYQMSGAYGGGRMTVLVKRVEEITDADGLFDAIPATDLAGRAGIMSAFAQPIATTDLLSIPTPFNVMLAGEGGALRGRAFRMDDGTPLPLTTINLTLTAFVY